MATDAWQSPHGSRSRMITTHYTMNLWMSMILWQAKPSGTTTGPCPCHANQMIVQQHYMTKPSQEQRQVRLRSNHSFESYV